MEINYGDSLKCLTSKNQTAARWVTHTVRFLVSIEVFTGLKNTLRVWLPVRTAKPENICFKKKRNHTVNGMRTEKKCLDLESHLPETGAQENAIPTRLSAR